MLIERNPSYGRQVGSFLDKKVGTTPQKTEKVLDAQAQILTYQHSDSPWQDITCVTGSIQFGHVLSDWKFYQKAPNGIL